MEVLENVGSDFAGEDSEALREQLELRPDKRIIVMLRKLPDAKKPVADERTFRDSVRGMELVRREEPAVAASLISRGLLLLQIYCIEGKRRVGCA